MGHQCLYDAITQKALQDYLMEVLGRLHPLLVHLPIGIIILAILFKLLYYRSKDEKFRNVLPTILLIGLGLSGLSVVTGFLHARGGEYDEDLLYNHRLYALLFTIAQGLLYLNMTRKKYIGLEIPVWFLMGFALFLTGDYGGNITHGYNLFTIGKSTYTRKSIENIHEASVYSDIIAPIFSSKCYSCHSSKKQKGNLRLDSEEGILKGGKHGAVLSNDTIAESKLIHRILLDEEEENHMPPQGKSPLSVREIKTLQWWIKNGADFDKKVKDYTDNKMIVEFYGKKNTPRPNELVPDIQVPAPDEASIGALQKSGIAAGRIAQNSNFVSINLNGKNLTNDQVVNLSKLSKNIIWLNANQSPLTADLLNVISTCDHLTSLDLSHTNLNDTLIGQLGTFRNLKNLNLASTLISTAGLNKLIGLKSLLNLYLFETHMNSLDFITISKLFQGARIDTGSYYVPILFGDTTKMTREEWDKEAKAEAGEGITKPR
ncbi:MAG: c-type cytochrome domain-containing protein [Saprospiraceae bacterium]